MAATAGVTDAQDESPQNQVTPQDRVENISSTSMLDKSTIDAEGQSRKATLGSKPAAGQIIHHQGKAFTTVKEGLAYILVPPDAKKLNDPKEGSKKKREKGDRNEEHLVNQSVFYNEIMQYNRDLSVLAIRAYGEDWLARQKLITLKRKKYMAQHREKAAAKKNRKEEALKATEANGSQAIDNASVHGNMTQDPEVHEQASMNGLKRQHEDMSAGAQDSPQSAKRSKGEAPTTTQASKDALDDSKRKEPDDSILDETGLLDEDLIGVENTTNGTRDSKAQPNKSRKSHFTVLDALSATGLRALRYAHELPFVDSVVANDLDKKATEMIAMNVEHNDLRAKITPVTGNAVTHMYQFVGQGGKGGFGKQYDVIDLDPYGTAVPFLDSALQALEDGGLLCVTCTDTAVFMSNGYTEKAFSLYGGTTVKGQCSHEGGLRLMLHAIATTAAKYGIAIEPLLSLSIDYYARVFVRVKKSPAMVKFLMNKTMTLNHCDSGCFAIIPQWLGRSRPVEDKKGNVQWKHGYERPSVGEFCEQCGIKTHVNGPMWGGPLHNPSFIDRILSYLPEVDKSTYPTHARIEGMLTTAFEELQTFHREEKMPRAPAASDSATADGPVDAVDPALIEPTPPEIRDLHPFYIFPSSLAKVLHCIAPSETLIRGALRHAGFAASRTHCARGGIKTNAPHSAVWHIMREWVRQKAPIAEGRLKEGMAGWKIMYDYDPALRRKAASMGATGIDADSGAEKKKETASEGAPQTDSDTLMTDAGNAAGEVHRQSSGPENAAGDMDSAIGSRPHQASAFDVVFDEDLGKDKGKRLKRFQLNPRANWGPMARAK